MNQKMFNKEELENLLSDILVVHNTSKSNSGIVAHALVQAQIDEQYGHGLSRIPSYASQAKVGKVNGYALPKSSEVSHSAVRIDAENGFAYPAMKLAREELIQRTNKHSIAIATIHNSHHLGVAGYHVEKLSEHGLIGLLFSNSPKAMAPWGGTKGTFGTNPIAFSAPRKGNIPLVIDLSLSKVARGKVMVASKKGESIPDDWALDSEGNPTTDPHEALKGTMLPMGDAKGAALVLMVEILAAALSGSQFAYEASSLFDAEGPPPNLGHTLIAIDPHSLSGGTFSERLEVLLKEILSEANVRLPGERRLQARQRAERNGVAVPYELCKEIQWLD